MDTTTTTNESTGNRNLFLSIFSPQTVEDKQRRKEERNTVLRLMGYIVGTLVLRVTQVHTYLG